MKKTWGDKLYSEERLNLFWRALQNTPNEFVESAIDSLIAENLRPPLIHDLSKAVDIAKNRHYSDRNNQGMPEVLRRAENETKADPDLVNACLKTFHDFQTGVLTREQFLEHCQELDRLASEVAKLKEFESGRYGV